ncbi:MAG TPA: hypothetical protein VGX23_15720 [Actinocrinis sp.]|nr:hypothetical protein [Actinocrinis sp.]
MLTISCGVVRKAAPQEIITTYPEEDVNSAGIWPRDRQQPVPAVGPDHPVR